MSTGLAAGPAMPPVGDRNPGGSGGGGTGWWTWFSVTLLTVASVAGWLRWTTRPTTTPTISTELAFNFGPADMPVDRHAPGMRHDVHQRFDQVRGYGWLDDLDRRYRSHRSTKDQPLAYASAVFVGDARNTSTFAVRVPAGRYRVQVVVGWAHQGPHRVVVEGQRLIDGDRTTRDQPYITADMQVAVQDGRLDIELGTDDGPANVGTAQIDTGLVSLRIRQLPDS